MKIEKSVTLCLGLLLVTSVFCFAFCSEVGTDEVEAVSDERIGDEIEEDPKQIEDIHDLQEMDQGLDAHYVIIDDIDASETYDWNSGGFEPVGDEDEPFTGTLDGQGFKITELFVDRPDSNYVGLFGNLGDTAQVSGVTLEDVDITGKYYVGALAGFNSGSVSDSSSSGRVEGNDNVGGLVGRNYGGLLNAHSKADVTGFGRVGGLVGRNDGETTNSYAKGDVDGSLEIGGLSGTNHHRISYSYATGGITGDFAVGGLVGLSHSSVTTSYAMGSVVGSEERVGGLVGYNYYGTVSDSYAEGSVDGNYRVGGLVGLTRGEVKNSYSIASVTETGDMIGGLVGEDTEAVVSNGFWDVEASGMDASDGGTGKSTAEMKDVATYTDTSTAGLSEPWDFVGDPNDDEGDENIWDIDEDEELNHGYPFLAWKEDPVEYNLTVDIEGEGLVRVEGQEIADGWTEEFEEGEELTVEAIEDKEGWYFAEWIGDVPESEKEKSEITVEMNDDKEITASFQEYTEHYDLTINIDGEGSVEIDGEEVEDGRTKTYEEGTEVELQAKPGEDRYFVNWTGDHESDEEEITVTMDEDKEITAHFEEEAAVYHELTVNVEGQGQVEKEPEREKYQEGTEVILKAVADVDWRFDRWSGDVPGGEEEDSETDMIMDQDKNITANFLREPYFEVDIVDHCQEVKEGEFVVIDYIVVNTGDIEDTQEVGLTVSGELKKIEDVSLTGGSEFSGEFIWPTEEEDAGVYELSVASADDEEAVNVTVLRDAFFEVEIVDHHDEALEQVTVGYEVTNTGGVEAEQTIEIKVNDEVEERVEIVLGPGEKFEDDFVLRSEDPGEYLLQISSEDEDDEVIVNIEEGEEGIPGFLAILFALVVIAASAVIIIYKKKKQ